jgi:hypothetical protein
MAANFAMLRELPGAAWSSYDGHRHANRMQYQSAYLFSMPRSAAVQSDRFSITNAGGSAIGELIVQPPPTAPGSIDPCQ